VSSDTLQKSVFYLCDRNSRKLEHCDHSVYDYQNFSSDWNFNIH